MKGDKREMRRADKKREEETEGPIKEKVVLLLDSNSGVKNVSIFVFILKRKTKR